MKYFFLIGTQAVGHYPDIQKIEPFDGDVIMFDTDTMTPPELLDMAYGWYDHVAITEEEYDQIFPLLYPELVDKQAEQEVTRKYEVATDRGQEGATTIASFETEEEAIAFMKQHQAVHPSINVFTKINQ
jgi:hypothetical protein